MNDVQLATALVFAVELLLCLGLYCGVLRRSLLRARSELLDATRDLEAARLKEREALGLMVGYREQARKHGLLVIRKSDGQEVCLRGHIWADSPEGAQ